MRKADSVQQRHFMRQVIEKIELKRCGELEIVWKFSEVFTAVEEMVASRQNWLASPERRQPLLPPVPITNVLQFTTIKSFRNESFLRQKYLEDGASLDEIAAQTLSSRKTVRRYLVNFEILLRPPDRLIREPEKFGTRRVMGQLIESKKEVKAIEQMTLLRGQGHSYREIVSIMNDLKIPCRKAGAKWHVKTVFNALKWCEINTDSFK